MIMKKASFHPFILASLFALLCAHAQTPQPPGGVQFDRATGKIVTPINWEQANAEAINSVVELPEPKKIVFVINVPHGLRQNSFPVTDVVIKVYLKDGTKGLYYNSSDPLKMAIPDQVWSMKPRVRFTMSDIHQVAGGEWKPPIHEQASISISSAIGTAEHGTSGNGVFSFLIEANVADLGFSLDQIDFCTYALMTRHDYLSDGNGRIINYLTEPIFRNFQ